MGGLEPCHDPDWIFLVAEFNSLLRLRAPILDRRWVSQLEASERAEVTDGETGQRFGEWEEEQEVGRQSL